MPSTRATIRRALGVGLACSALAATTCTPSGAELPTTPGWHAEGPRPAPAATPKPSHAGPGTMRRSSARARYQYRFRVDAALTRLDGELCLRHTTARLLGAQVDAAGRLLSAASAAGRPLDITAQGIALRAMPVGGCVRYRIDLQAALSSAAAWDGAVRVGHDALLSPDLWLLEPQPRDPTAEVVARFDLPASLRVAVPWPRAPSGAYPYTVVPSTFVYRSAAAFGRLQERRIEVSGGRVDVAILGGGFGRRAERVLTHLRRSASAAAGIMGGLPAPRIRLLLVPRPAGAGSFGYAVRGGGATVVLLLPRDVDGDDFLDNWHATHELLHFCLPPMSTTEAWWFEGVTTYLAAVARARAGLISEPQMWWELLDGFARGRQAGTGRTLQAESRAMHRTGAYWRVYWAGAALALQIDVGLRRKGSSLAAVLADLARGRSDALRSWTGRELAREIDRVSATTVASEVVHRQLKRSEFPEVLRLTRQLGVTLHGGRQASIDPGAPGAPLRTAIAQHPRSSP